MLWYRLKNGQLAEGTLYNQTLSRHCRLHNFSKLKQLKEKDQPFFMAVGFLKPHLPFIAPQKYWDPYDREQIQLPDKGWA